MWLNWKSGVGVAALLILVLIIHHAMGGAALATAKPEVLPVSVARVTREDLFSTVTVPAEFRPYLQVELHAKVSGYVEQISVDIGDEVKSGQLLAQIEVPELKDELDHAEAVQRQADADSKEATQVFSRLQKVNQQHPNLVAEQDLDTARSKDLAAAAALAAAKAGVNRYKTLISYTKITAPFDGVVTRRYADPGSLIQAGTTSDTQSMPLVRLSDNYKLRLDIPVPVSSIKDVHVGDAIEVRVDSLGGRSFRGKISRCTQKVEDETRTMIMEAEVPNPNLELVPGMFATAVLKTAGRTQALSVPSQAIGGGKKSTVYVVNASNEIEERPVSLGLETATRYEALSGLKEGDLVMVGNRSQVRLGQKVEPKLSDAGVMQ
jgi:RND family efflux transporter MFP subunit